jgi:hypothetical protein
MKKDSRREIHRETATQRVEGAALIGVALIS